MSIIIIYTFVFIIQILYTSCSFHACLPVCCMLLYFLSSYRSMYSFVQILTLICSILFAYLLAVFFIVQIHYASSCFVVRFCFVVFFFSFVGRTPKLADCAIVQPLCSSCALKFPYIKKKILTAFALYIRSMHGVSHAHCSQLTFSTPSKLS